MLDWLISWGRRKLAEEKEEFQPSNLCTDPEVCTLHKPSNQTTDLSSSKIPVVFRVKESKHQEQIRREVAGDLATFRSDRGRLG